MNTVRSMILNTKFAAKTEMFAPSANLQPPCVTPPATSVPIRVFSWTSPSAAMPSRKSAAETANWSCSTPRGNARFDTRSPGFDPPQPSPDSGAFFTRRRGALSVRRRWHYPPRVSRRLAIVRNSPAIFPVIAVPGDLFPASLRARHIPFHPGDSPSRGLRKKCN